MVPAVHDKYNPADQIVKTFQDCGIQYVPSTTTAVASILNVLDIPHYAMTFTSDDLSLK
jgi:hypothetical protein